MYEPSRRQWLLGVPSILGALLVFDNPNAAGQTRRPVRQRTRRRVRRRVRRRAVRRVVQGRPVWVVPIGIAVGWELAYENRIVVVTDITIAERDGMQVQVASVQDSLGKTEHVEILHEDTDDNRKDLEGTVLPGTDTTTPGVDSEVDN